MNKIRIIDLLNKIANGEEVPNKIKWEDIIYAYSEYDKDYLEYPFSDEEYKGLFDMRDNILTQFLNDEVEILEEKKKIPEKLEDRARFQYSEIPTWLEKKEIIKAINENFEKHQKAIYEIIDYLNYLKSKEE